jgi:hypothetical protein
MADICSWFKAIGNRLFRSRPRIIPFSRALEQKNTVHIALDHCKILAFDALWGKLFNMKKPEVEISRDRPL